MLLIKILTEIYDNDTVIYIGKQSTTEKKINNLKQTHKHTNTYTFYI